MYSHEKSNTSTRLLAHFYASYWKSQKWIPSKNIRSPQLAKTRSAKHTKKVSPNRKIKPHKHFCATWHVTADISCRKSFYLEKILARMSSVWKKKVQSEFNSTHIFLWLWVMQTAFTGQILVSPVFKIEVNWWVHEQCDSNNIYVRFPVYCTVETFLLPPP